jgi:hypothetical protein
MTPKEEKLLSELEKIQERGQKTPLEFMLAVMWNKKATVGIRLEAAKSAAPYVHKKMPLDIQHDGRIEIIPPFVPSRGELAKDFIDELSEDEDL